MTSRKWLILTLSLTLLGGGGFIGLNVCLDIYGLFRDSRGRQLPIYDTEQRAKYLLSRHYVPANFRAVLIGTSVSGNLPTAGLSILPTYNLSTDGGNVSEEKVLAERAILSPGIEVAICLVHPYLTDTHGITTKEMNEREISGALGSISLLRAYHRLFMTATGRAKLSFDWHGAEIIEGPIKLNPVLTRIFAAEPDFAVDAEAFAEYRRLIEELRARKIRVIGLVPPTWQGLLDPKRAAIDRYTARMRTLFDPQDPFIDMNGPEYADLWADRSIYTDGVHFTIKGAGEVVKRLDLELRLAGL